MTAVADESHVHAAEPPAEAQPRDLPDDDDAALPASRRTTLFKPGGALRPFRLLIVDAANLRRRWASDWFFNQLVLASAVYLFFTNLLPGITFASDLYAQTGRNYGAIEVVFSTGLCGCIFAL